MSLIDRLAGINNPEGGQKLAVNTFHSGMYELAAGQVTKAGLVAYFALNPAEEADLDWIISVYNAKPNATEKAKFVELLRNVFILAEANVPGYTTSAELSARLSL